MSSATLELKCDTEQSEICRNSGLDTPCLHPYQTNILFCGKIRQSNGLW